MNANVEYWTEEFTARTWWWEGNGGDERGVQMYLYFIISYTENQWNKSK